MIVAVVAEKKIDGVLPSIRSVEADIDVIEWRLDILDTWEFEHIKAVFERIHKPCILTLRSLAQGGAFQGSESERLSYLLLLAKLNPAYMDIEYDVSDAFIAALHAAYPSIQLIRSYHNLNHTCNALAALLAGMAHPAIRLYKLVTYAASSIDALRLLALFRDNPNPGHALILHCMGPWSLASRVMGAVLGNYFTYARIPGCSALAALDLPEVATLKTVYRLHRCNAETKIFALLGDPVAHSIGDDYHNQQFTERRINAVYVKIRLRPEALGDFFDAIKQLPFGGFSITRPLKEKVISYIDRLDPEAKRIGAVNTIVVQKGKLHGFNTDGLGAVAAIANAIQSSLKGRHVLLLGAGGSGKAIAHATALQEPASLTIVNRNAWAAQALASKVRGRSYAMNALPAEDASQFDVVISTLPNAVNAAPGLWDWIASRLTPASVVLSIDYASDASPLWDVVRAIGCTWIDPKAMFVAQALRQADAWLAE